MALAKSRGSGKHASGGSKSKDSKKKTRSSGGSSSKSSGQVGLNDSQISQLRGLSGIDQGALDRYISSGSKVGGRNNPSGRGREAITPDSLDSQDTYQPPESTVVTGGPDMNINNASVTGNGITYEGGQFVIDPNASDRENAVAEANAGALGAFQQYVEDSKPDDPNATENAFYDTREQLRIAELEAARNKQTNIINTITANRDAAQLGLEGQGRGITDTIIGGQQARIGREAAIQALPHQALLAAAQGDLDSANALLGQLFTAKSADIAANATYKQNLAKSALDFATTAQANTLAAKMADIGVQETTAQANLAYQRQLGLQALEYGQNGLITGIAGVDPSSPTFEQDIAAFTSQLRKPVTGAGRQAPTTKVIGDDLYQYNYETGQWELAVGSGLSPTEMKAQEEDKAKVDQALGLQTLLDQVVMHPGFKAGVGSPGEKLTGDGLYGLISPIPGLGGAVQQGAHFLSGQKAGFDALFDQVVEGITIEQLGKMSGPKTDKDIEVLRKGAVRLNKATTEAEFLEVKEEMYNALQRIIDVSGVTPEQSSFYYGIDPATQQEASDFYDIAGTSIHDAQFPSYNNPNSLFPNSVAF